MWKALAPRFTPDLIVGASAGAWNGWAIAGGCPIEELIATWLDPVTATIMQPGLHASGVMLPEVLHRKARELFERYRPSIPFGLTMVEIPHPRPRLVRDSEITWQHLAATCSIPFCFPPVHIDGKAWVDGGLVGALPLWAAGDMGATRAIAVNVLTSMPFRVLRRVLPPRRPVAPLDITLIEPSEKLGTLRDAVRWSRANIERWIELGERDANRTLTFDYNVGLCRFIGSIV